MLTDLRWARAARAAAARRAARATPARAVIYSSTTAALLWPRPGAIRFDAPAAGNRPGRHGLWQRPLERRRLRQAPLLLPWSEGGARARLPRRRPRAASARSCCRSPVEPSGAAGGASATSPRSPTPPTRQEGPRPRARRLAARCARRRAARSCVVAGRRRERAARRRARSRRRAGRARRRARSPPEEYRALLRRARVFVCAPRREDYGHRPARGARRRLPCSSRRRRPGPTPRCRSRASSTRAWSATTSRRRCAPRSTTRSPDYAERALRGARAVQRARRSTGSSPSELLPRLLALALLRARAQRARVGDVARRVSHARRAVATPQRMFASVSRAVGVGVDHDRHAGARGGARVDVGEVAAVGVGVDLEHRARCARPPRTPPRGRPRRARGARSGGPVGWPIASHQRVLDRRDHALGHRLLGHRRTRCARWRSPSRARASSSSS